MRLLLPTFYLMCILFDCDARAEALQQETVGPKWGDVSGLPFFQERIKKGRLAFLTRCHTIEYPLVLLSNSGDGASETPHLRGLDHTNLVDNNAYAGCMNPDVELKAGGPNQPSATIEICSKRGCPLDSIVQLYRLN